jgi:hypothetical protein
MFKFPSQKISLIFLLLFCGGAALAKPSYKTTAIIEYVIDEQNLMATSDSGDWNVGEILPIMSQNSKIGVFAYGELISVKYIQLNRYNLKLKLLRQSRKYLIQQGDYIKRLNLGTENSDYVGTTDLLVKKSEMPVSAKYKPLVYQGIFIGETAQMLYHEEFLINFLGNAYYGLHENVMIGSYLPLNFLTGANGSVKVRVYDSESTTLAAGLSYADVKEKGERTLNLNLYWDSISSDTLLSHVYLSLGLIKWEDSGDAKAIKTLGSSSFQTGYEVILSNWDRFLVGPSYNFDTKALGGYLAYVWIYDKFHAEASINTTNITSLKVNPGDGYYGAFDLYWRF